MFTTLAVILIVLWALGLLGGYAGGLLHMLLVTAVVMLLIRAFSGRRFV